MFQYARPESLDEALALLRRAPDARVLAGGTDLIIGLRNRVLRPSMVIDLKRLPELAPAIDEADGRVRISAGTTMTDLIDSPVIRRLFPALVEAARIVGSIQIRNRATLVGNQCNASPAADTAPPLLVYDAELSVVGPNGERRLRLDDFFVRSGVTTLQPGELVTAITLPVLAGRSGSAFQRRTRRRGHDLASVTLAVSLDDVGRIRLAYGSLGPRPLLFEHAGADAPLEDWFAHAQPSAGSMRAGPDYRLAMLRDDLGLTGAKECCLVGECGACTVRLNGRIVDACLVLAVEVDGAEVTTVEGLAAGGRLTRLQSTFLEKGAVQCGFCIPGQLMAGDDLLRRHAHPARDEIEEGIAGNLCRCGCYYQIVEAIEAAAGAPPASEPAVAESSAAREMPPHVVDQ